MPILLNLVKKNARAGSNLDTFSENVEHIFSDAKGMKTIFVCGDLNIDLLKHESHKNTRNFLDIM